MIELDVLLAPLRDGSPCGEDLSFSAEFDAIQEARRCDDASLDQGEWVTDLKESDWKTVQARCIALLSQRSKDLRLGMWLTEALSKLHGFAGLKQGLELMTGLCERFWDGIHPLPDEDQEQRIGNLTWLLARCSQLMLEQPLTDAPGMRHSVIDHESALQLARQIARNPAEAGALSEGRLTLEHINRACHATPKPFFVNLVQDMEHCIAAIGRFEAAVDARLGREGPAFLAVRQVADKVNELAQKYAREVGALSKPTAPSATEATLVNASADAAVLSSHGGAISHRAQALQRLHEVAEFFKRTEPHSPVSYLVDKAARWGEMPLHTWLRSVVKDTASLSHLEEMLGVEQVPTQK